MPLSNVPTQVPLRHRGKGAACRSALVRLLPGVTLVVGAQGLLPRRSVRAARPRARVRLLPRVIAVLGVQEGLIGRMDRGRQLAARFGRGLVKAKANVALDASVQFSCAHVHTLQFVVAVRSTKLEKQCAEPASNLQEHAMAGVHAAAPGRGRADAGRP